MVDSIGIRAAFPEGMSAEEQSQYGFPYTINQKTNEQGEITYRFLEEEALVSPLTGAKCKVRALAHTPAALDWLSGYELKVNPPACLIGRNYLLVNGVYQAARGALELLKHHAASRGCSAEGLEFLQLQNTKLTSVTNCFLFEFGTPEEALAKKQELRDYLEGILNHVLPADGARKRKKLCFSIGSDDCFSVYVRLRHMSVLAYVKEPDVPGAFAKFPSEDVKEQLEALAQRTLRVEITVHAKWLRDNDLDSPEAWCDNPAAYEKVFGLLREALRLDENLRCRAPSEAVIAKLPEDHRTILSDHLKGKNARRHELVLNCQGYGKALTDARNKRFSAFKCPIMKETGIDITIPWKIQSTKLSPRLRDWLKFRREYEPDESLTEVIYSRTSVPPAIRRLQEKTAEILAQRA